MRGTIKALEVAGVTLAAALGLVATAGAAIVTSR
jgi:hypothetical protein